MALVDRLSTEEIGARLLKKLWGDTVANLQPVLDASRVEAAKLRPFEKSDTLTFTDSRATVPANLLKAKYMIVDGEKEVPRYRYWDVEDGVYKYGGGFYYLGAELVLMFTFAGDATVYGFWTPTEEDLESQEDYQEAVLALAASKAFSKMSTAIAREKDIGMEGIPDIKDASIKFTNLAAEKLKYAMDFLKSPYASSL